MHIAWLQVASHGKTHGSSAERDTVVPADIAVVLAMASHGKPRDNIHGKTPRHDTRQNTRGGNVHSETHGDAHGKAATWQDPRRCPR